MVSDEYDVLIGKETTGTYSCSCTGNNNCDVIYVLDNFGCAHEECSGNCSGHYSIDANNKNTNCVFVNTNQNIEPIANNKDFKALPYLPEMVLKQKDVQGKLEAYANSIYGENYSSSLREVDQSIETKSDINSIVYIDMKMYGFKFRYGIVVDNLKESVLRNNNFDRILENSTPSRGACSKGSSLGVQYCKCGGCKTCTMNL